MHDDRIRPKQFGERVWGVPHHKDAAHTEAEPAAQGHQDLQHPAGAVRGHAVAAAGREAALRHLHGVPPLHVLLLAAEEETFVGHDEEDWMRLNSIEDPTDNAQLYLACTCSIFNVISGLAGGKSAAEQIFSVIVICIAAVCFGLVLGEMQEVYATSNSKIRAVEMHLESVMVFLDEHRVQQDLVKSIRKWMHFQYVQRIQDRESQEILERLPTSMRQVLACVMNKQLFAKVALFSRISSEGSLKDEFTSELLLSMESEYFSIGSVIAAACTPANRLMVVVSGNICVRDPFDANSTLAILGPG
eukprot:CAMPEP_0172184020 /NCGR_PEP_ID=MMETSP1050-20130122/19333_1 /TAXON_ID=233186 /ORGANISM="Cryptomonas curvata, Strain CCAP979/52" /LENGTH=302 /DNA_ID=CAMNT_0012857751 /DNA_START=298 /DNA_END=1207 /DNA_ORIENTATION=-